MELNGRTDIGRRRDAERLVGIHTRLNGVLAELLAAVSELNTDEALLANGMTDAMSWLRFDLGLSRRTARAWVRAAEVLADLPATARAFENGSISIDELLVLARFATVQNEEDLLGLTRDVDVEDLSAAIREFLDEPKPDKAQPPRPSLRTWWDDTSLQLRGSIPGADGVLVETALMRLAAKAPLDPTTGLYRDPEERDAEALIQMASESTAEDRDHDRATVVVHVSLDTLSGPDSTVNIGGREYGRDELMRLTCDGRLQPAIDDPSGVTIGIGRVSRQIPAWLRRTMNERDGGCRFPSCSRTRWTHGHHLVHWANGGPTNLDNLITLCGFHHRLIHRPGWDLEVNSIGEVEFLKWGRPHVPARPAFSDEHQKLLVDSLSFYAEHRLGLLATANSPP
jgi:hypothetical protein